jgi:hypothetical protein
LSWRPRGGNDADAHPDPDPRRGASVRWLHHRLQASTRRPGRRVRREAPLRNPGLLTFVAFDDHRYYLETRDDKKAEVIRYRAHATRIEGEPFLSVTEIGKPEGDEWHFLGYDVRATDRLRLRFVDPDPFKDVLDDPAAVRERLARELQNPEVVGEYLSCVRVEETK